MARGIAAVSRTRLPSDEMTRRHASESTPACSTRPPTSCGCCGSGSRSSASTGSRSGTTSTARPARRTTPRASRPSRCTPRWPARPSASQCGVARLLDRLPPPRRAGQGDHGDRPDLGRPGGDGHRRRVGRGRVPGLRHRVPDRSAPAWTSSRRASPSSAGCSTTRRRRSTASGSRPTRAAQRAPPDPGRPADLGRRLGREADAAHRRPVRRRVERAVRVPRDVRRQARRCCTATAPTSGATRPRSLCAVNLGLAWTEDSLRQQFGAIAEFVRPGVLGGRSTQVVDRIGEYVEAGADQVNLALRAPFDVDALEQFSASMRLT